MTYAFDNSWEQERDRLRTLEEIWDPQTVGHLERLGICEGWKCLEIGGGGGSLVEWLSLRVGKNGKVVATDIDTRFLDALSLDNLEVRRHDITTDPLPWMGMDLVHARAVVEHLPLKHEVLRKMADALRPGGWLVVEDFDWTSGNYPVQGSKTFQKVTDAVFTLMGAGGYDKEYGRQLPADIAAMGLTQMGGFAKSVLLFGGTRQMGFYSLALERFRKGLVGSGLLEEQDIEDALTEMADPKSITMSPVIVTAWGCKT